eukprot:gnl/TRDRNA2_/TRDRNA2_195383_c0_seq1.p1 gnl/TRDRNA2_/TRDRNA2_195383_c0~~gnl/TRDRNA2_/TRDRNA2_195383_c0_seq1.p1  ORF type:complete len:256 (+),score=24.47 gnl/TRDRNA2_/TRDRNA2_195383_c0_seq1:145-912(+)
MPLSQQLRDILNDCLCDFEVLGWCEAKGVLTPKDFGLIAPHEDEVECSLIEVLKADGIPVDSLAAKVSLRNAWQMCRASMTRDEHSGGQPPSPGSTHPPNAGSGWPQPSPPPPDEMPFGYSTYGAGPPMWPLPPIFGGSAPRPPPPPPQMPPGQPGLWAAHNFAGSSPEVWQGPPDFGCSVWPPALQLSVRPHSAEAEYDERLRAAKTCAVSKCPSLVAPSMPTESREATGGTQADCGHGERNRSRSRDGLKHCR